MENISIIVGSQMGSAEYVAEQLQEALEAKGLSVSLFEQPQLVDIKDTYWLICTSTHGAGELPDNIKDFANEIADQESLSDIKYSVVGLGDSSYDQYNQAAKTLDQMILNKGGQCLLDRLEIDAQDEALPEDIALEWLPQLLKRINM